MAKGTLSVGFNIGGIVGINGIFGLYNRITRTVGCGASGIGLLIEFDDLE
jgi:hypothetical protein